MILKKILITDFLSIAGTIECPLDDRATILLGANDHGKSNILEAISRLNDDRPIKEEDRNWDAVGPPEIRFEFELNEAESRTVGVAIAAESFKIAGVGPASSTIEPENPAPTVTLPAGTDVVLGERLAPGLKKLVLSRSGIGSPLTLSDGRTTSVVSKLKDAIPRVELFSSTIGQLQDSVTAEELVTPEYEFLQGVFYYAGIDPYAKETPALFSQNDRTVRRLDDASRELDKQIRGIWGQGVDLDLHFELRHRQHFIDFLANDPAVKNQKARMSKRSAGVTQFFRLSMMLHARRKKNPANSYIYLFDEPGVYLHPKGQKDLIQVFESLADEAQIVYATHSLFMLNQNFPERHRLIVRSADGTKVDHKPFKANWRLATDALGTHLTANILFSPTVLLVEGDSDPLYTYELFRQLNVNKLLDADANLLGVFSYDANLPKLNYLLQVFRDDNRPTRVVVLFDGDSSGRRMLKNTKELCAVLKVSAIELADGKSIEDYVLFPELFANAVELTICNAAKAEGVTLPADYTVQFQARWAAYKQNAATTRGRWFVDTAKHFLNKKEASKVALARNYALLCRESSEPLGADANQHLATALCKDVAEKLALPSVKAAAVVEAKA